MRFSKIHVLLLAAGMACGAVGCTVQGEAEPVAVAPAPVVVAPGYYYDGEYVDVHGFHHPRTYYYYDGRTYVHRDYLPHGYVAHERWHDEHDRR